MAKSKLIMRALNAVSQAARGGSKAMNVGEYQRIRDAVRVGERVAFSGMEPGSATRALFTIGKGGEKITVDLPSRASKFFAAADDIPTTLIGNEAERLPALRALSRRYRGKLADKPGRTLLATGLGGYLGASAADDLILDPLSGGFEQEERLDRMADFGEEAIRADQLQRARAAATQAQLADGLQRIKQARPDIYNQLLAGQLLAPGEIPIGGVPRYDLLQEAVANLLAGQNVRSITAGTPQSGQITFKAPKESML